MSSSEEMSYERTVAYHVTFNGMLGDKPASGTFSFTMPTITSDNAFYSWSQTHVGKLVNQLLYYASYTYSPGYTYTITTEIKTHIDQTLVTEGPPDQLTGTLGLPVEWEAMTVKPYEEPSTNDE